MAEADQTSGTRFRRPFVIAEQERDKGKAVAPTEVICNSRVRLFHSVPKRAFLRPGQFRSTLIWIAGPIFVRYLFLLLQPVGIADMQLFRPFEFSFSLHDGDSCEAVIAERDCGSIWNWAMDKAPRN